LGKPSPELSVRYTVWSRDRLLGETDLGFVRCMEKLRAGFFHPTELAESLMTFDERSSWAQFDDIELRDADGALIPTEDIGIQDTERLLALYPADDDVEPLFPEDEDPELLASIQHDLELLEEHFEYDDSLDLSPSDDATWEESRFPRYQIQVTLVDDASVP
jgi:hypothetical protein